MTIKGDIRGVLINAATVSGKVGDQVTPGVPKVNATEPYITYTEISNDHRHTMDSKEINLQLTIVDDNYPDKEVLVADVISALDASSLSVSVDNSSDDYEPETGNYVTFLDISASYGA